MALELLCNHGIAEMHNANKFRCRTFLNSELTATT